MGKVAIKTFKDLTVWQKAFDLSAEIHKLTGDLPAHELYGLSSELRKTSRSIVYNIAEGHRRGSTVEYIRFLRISAGSAAELESQILLAKRLGYFQEKEAEKALNTLAEIVRMLEALSRNLKLKLRSNLSTP
jgi:four helix bundle protein